MTDGSGTRRVEELLSGVRFGKFVSVGVLGAICDMIVLITLSEGLGVLPEVATLAGIETAILVMFTINERWTFADEGADDRRSLLGRLKRSHVVRAAGTATQFVVFVIVYRGFHVSVTLADLGVWNDVVSTVGGSLAGLGGFDVWLVVAKATGIGIGMLVNYVFESLFTWRVGVE